MKRILKLSFVLVCALALSLCLMTAARAEAVSTIEGTVYASKCPTGDIVLTDDTVLIMDKDLSLRSLRGNYALNVKDQGGHTLKVTTPLDEHVITANGSGHAISVKSFKSNAGLNLTSRKDALNIDGEVRINGGNIVINAGGDAVYSRSADIEIRDAVMDITAVNGCIVTKDGKKPVSVRDSLVTAKTTGETAYCIVGSGVYLSGVIQATGVTNAVVSHGVLTVAGNLEATSTKQNSVAVNPRLGYSLIVENGGEITATGAAGICAQGSVIMREGAVGITVEASRFTGIEAVNGDIELRGDINVTAAEGAIYAPKGDITQISGTIVAETTGSEYSAIAGNNITFSGDSVTATANQSAVMCYGDLEINADLTAGSYLESCAAVNCPNGRVHFWPLIDVSVVSAGTGIYADNVLAAVSGTTLYVRAYTHHAVEAVHGLTIAVDTFTARSPEDTVYCRDGDVLLSGDEVTLTCDDDPAAIVRFAVKSDGGHDILLTGGDFKITSAGGGILNNKGRVLLFTASYYYNNGKSEEEIDAYYETVPAKLDIQAGEHSAVAGDYIDMRGELDFRSEDWHTVYCTGTVRMRKGCLGAVNVVGSAVYCRDFIFDGRDADRTFLNHQSDYYGFAVDASGTVTFKSGKITLFSKCSYAVESDHDVNFDGAYVRAISDKTNAVKSQYGNINVNAGTVSATAGGDHRPFLTASQGCGLRPSEDMRITTPEAGFIVKYDGGNYSDLVKSGAKPGVIPTDVDFESIPLEGSISINKTVARAGDELSINYHFDNVTEEATVYQEWQRSEDGVNWVTFDTVTTRYKVKAGDRGYYVRGVISEVSRCGKLCSPACFITTQTELSGGIVYTSAVRYTSPLSKAQTARTGLLGDLEKGANASSIIHYQWQRSADGVSGWTDIPKSESASALTTSYSVGSNDVNNYIRLKATVDGYTGAVVSSPKYVGKLAGAFQPDNYATLSCPDPYNSIYVTNAKATQEYVCSKTSTAPADWWGAFSPPSDGSFGFQCEPDTFYYVHTRNKETAYKEASGSIYTSVYTGSAPTVLKGLKLSKTSYRTKVGDSAFQLSVTPLPSDYASWNTATVRWFVNGGGVKLYTDKECTWEINGTSTITEKVVYAKPVAQAEHVYVGVEMQVGYNDTKVAQCKVDVADSSGNYILHSVSFDTLELFPGDSAVVSYRPSPSPAVVGALSFKKNDGIMPESELSLTDNGDGTVTVTAPEDCIEGTYYYKVTIADAPASSGYLSYIKVNVSLPEATVSFDDGGAGMLGTSRAGLRGVSRGAGMDAQTVPLGSEFILPENGFPVPDGYEFDGWDLGNSGDGINVTEDVVVAAVWRKHTHNMTYQEAKPSGCLTPGRMEHWYCEDCGKVYGDEAGLYPQEDIFLMIPAAGHHSNGDPVTENEIPATCLTAGSYDTVVYCTVCGEEISREHTDVKATGHTPGEEVRENTVQPTCADDGSYDEVHYCTVCGKEASRTTKTIPALGHDMTLVPAQASTCEVGGVTQHYVCSVCGGYFEDEYGNREIYDHHDVEGDPLDHELGEVSYEWAPDDSYVTASALCEWGHEVSETAFTKLEVLTPPSEYSDGEGKLTARFANPTFAEVEKTVTIPRGQVFISGGVSGDLLSYEVTDAPNESLLIAARYDNGKLTCVRFIYSPQTGAETMSGTGDTFKLMLLDENHAPICEAWVG